MVLLSVAFATACWEKDWQLLLKHPNYLKEKQIENHCFPFSEKILVINNVDDLTEVKKAAQKKVDEGILDRYVVAEEMADEVLSFFHLERSDFSNDWVYYNALAPLTAIYVCQSPYLLYLTGDVYLNRKTKWIAKALRVMKKHPNVKVANLTWNRETKEARRESYGQSWNFYWAKEGFSDQMFLVGPDFRQPIYKELRSDGDHYPRGDVFEKRAFSYLKNRGLERITYRWGSYTHKNV